MQSYQDIKVDIYLYENTYQTFNKKRFFFLNLFICNRNHKGDSDMKEREFLFYFLINKKIMIDYVYNYVLELFLTKDFFRK